MKQNTQNHRSSLTGMLRYLTLVVALCLATVPASASMTYNFSYTFQSGLKLTGSLDGDPNGNLVENLSNISVLLDGSAMTITPGPFPGIHAFGTIYSGGWNSTDGFTPSQPAVVSFDGKQNNFLFIDSDFPADFSGSYFFIITDPSFYYANASMGATASGTDGGVVSTDNIEDDSRWSLTPATVPDASSSLALLSMAGLALGVVRQKLGKN
jgi:hypothetical protein